MKTTKDLILEAAFSFYKKPYFVDFSLNQIADIVGISKTAIYRHFKNKEALLEAMNDKFYDLLAIQLAEFQKVNIKDKESCKVPFAETIQFFVKNPEYINYFINQFSCKTDFEDECRENLLKRGIDKNLSKFCNTSNEIESQIHSLFGGMSLLFFIKTREIYFKGKKKNDDNEFALKLVNFLSDGLLGCFDKNDIAYPVEISEERKMQLNDICKIDENSFPKEDKIFGAFATVINKFGLQNVTLERIASELNMAKSSLYFYFDNKNQMIFTLIERELALLEELFRENSIEAKNYSEFIYILLRTEINYFSIRSSILSIGGWLLQKSNEPPFSKEIEINNIWEKRLYEESKISKIDLGFPIKAEILTFWFGFLPVGLIIMGKKYNYTNENFYYALDRIFDFIQHGIN